MTEKSSREKDSTSDDGYDRKQASAVIDRVCSMLGFILSQGGCTAKEAALRLRVDDSASSNLISFVLEWICSASENWFQEGSESSSPSMWESVESVMSLLMEWFADCTLAIEIMLQNPRYLLLIDVIPEKEAFLPTNVIGYFCLLLGITLEYLPMGENETDSDMERWTKQRMMNAITAKVSMMKFTGALDYLRKYKSSGISKWIPVVQRRLVSLYTFSLDQRGSKDDIEAASKVLLQSQEKELQDLRSLEEVRIPLAVKCTTREE